MNRIVAIVAGLCVLLLCPESRADNRSAISVGEQRDAFRLV